MDLSPTPEQEAFRGEVRAWLVDNLPWEYGRGLPPRFEDLGEEVAFLRTWQEIGRASCRERVSIDV